MPLLERENHLEELNQALSTAVQDGGRLLLISGEAGIGKSSLIEAFTRRLPPGRRLLWGACDDLFTPRPLGPLHDIARQTEGELAALLQIPQDRPAIFNAVLNELHTPVIVVFEDIHWADEATLDLLKFLGRRMGRTRALLLATFRHDEVDQRHPLRLLLGDLTRQQTTRRIELIPLSPAAVAQLVGDRQVDIAALHQQTGGNPFYLRELLAARSDGIPTSIRDAVLARAARLSLSGRAVLEAAAVIGQRIEPWLLSGVVQAEAEALSESIKIGFLQSNPEFFTFRHELVRQTILDTLALHQRLFWHRAVLDVLKASPQAREDPARLAHHAAAARDVEAILEFGRAAGEEAAALGMHRAAITWLELAAPWADALTPVEQFDLQLKIGVNNQTNDLPKSLNAFTVAADVAQRANLTDALGLARAHQAVVHYRLGQLKRCDRLLAEVLEQADPPASRAALNIAYPLWAMRQLLQGDPADAIIYADKARQMALESGTIEDVVRANQLTGMCLLPLDHRRGLWQLKSTLQEAIENDFYRAVGTIYANLIMHTLDVYQLQEVHTLLPSAKAYLVDHDLDFNLILVLAWEGMLRLFEGQWAVSEALAKQILDGQAAPIARIPALVAYGRSLVRQGDFQQGEAYLSTAGQLSIKINNQQRIGIYYCAAAEAAWLHGDEEEVARLVADFYDTAVKNKLPGFGGEIAYWAHRIGQTPALYEWMVEPFVLEINGDWRGAAAGWEALGCPYEQARALAGGDIKAQKTALVMFEQLGARPMIERLRHALREAGIQAIPRGPRAATQENPFGLTNRQVDVLRLLVEELTNAEIAARLHISPKTVDHHVSAVLGKMGVASREEAAAAARPHFT